MTKLTDKEKKQIIAEYVDCQNYSLVAKKHKRSVNTIKRIVLADEEVANKVKEKKEANTQDALMFFDEMREDVNRLLKKMLCAIEYKVDDLNEKTNVRDIATAMGIILDKQYRSIELQRGTASNEQLNKVQELINKLDDEAKR